MYSELHLNHHIRPHEALDMKTPAKMHDFSTRPFPEKITSFDYDPKFKVQKVTQNGSLRWRAYYWIYISASLSGKYLGLEDLGNGIWRVYFRSIFLGYFDETDLRNKEQAVRLETNLV